MRIDRLIAATASLLCTNASAQALSPMRQDFATYADQFVIRLTARNPYPTAQTFAVSVYEADRTPSQARALTPTLTLAPAGTTVFMVAGDNPGDEPRTLIVCVTSAPFAHGRGAVMKGEVCGNYRILRRAF